MMILHAHVLSGGRSQDYKTGCPELAIIKTCDDVLLFNEDQNIFR